MSAKLQKYKGIREMKPSNGHLSNIAESSPRNPHPLSNISFKRTSPQRSLTLSTVSFSFVALDGTRVWFLMQDQGNWVFVMGLGFLLHLKRSMTAGHYIQWQLGELTGCLYRHWMYRDWQVHPKWHFIQIAKITKKPAEKFSVILNEELC